MALQLAVADRKFDPKSVGRQQILQATRQGAKQRIAFEVLADGPVDVEEGPELSAQPAQIIVGSHIVDGDRDLIGDVHEKVGIGLLVLKSREGSNRDGTDTFVADDEGKRTQRPEPVTVGTLVSRPL